MSQKIETKVIVIEDNFAVRTSIAAYLENSDFDVLQAENGLEGMELFRSEKPDIVLVDLRMPKMDGLEVISAIQKESPDTPIVVVSGTGNISDAIEAIRLGAWDYILKPIIDMADLEHVVNTALERAKLRNENRRYQQRLEEEVARKTEELRQTNEELLRVNARLRKIIETAGKLSTQMEVDQLGSRLMEAFGRHILATGGSLYLVGDGKLRLVHSLDPGHAPSFIPFPLCRGSLFERAIRKGKPILVDNLERQKKSVSSGWNGYKDESILVFPLPNEQGKIIGVLSLHSKTDPPFTLQDKEIGSLLAIYACEALRATRSANALEISEERFRIAAECASDLIFEWDIATDNLKWFGEIDEALGYEMDEFSRTFEAWMESIHPDERQLVTEALNSCRKCEKPLFVEYRIRQKDGRWLYWKSRGTIVLDDSGKPHKLIGVCTDVTERKLAYEALRAEHDQTAQIIRESPAIICGITPDETITFINPAGEQVTGYSSDELVGKNCWRTFYPGIEYEQVKQLFRDFKKGDVRDYEMGLTTKNGDKRTVTWSSASRFDKDGKLAEIIGFGIDITERKQTEEERQQLEAQMQRVQRMESIGRLTGGVAHDFNNLLTPIIGYADMMLMRMSKQEPHYDFLMEIRGAGNRAKDLTRQLLAFSRKQVLNMMTFNLNMVVNGFEKILRRTIRENIDIQIKLASDLGNVKADMGQIEQIIMNLAVNGQDAMPDGGKMIIETANVFLDEVHVKTYPDAQTGHHVMLSISDTGCGIDSDILEHIFEPFFTTKDRDKGTGLGLSTVYGVVRQHGGSIEVYSKVGYGTTFRLYLPRVDEVADSLTGTSSDEQASGRGNETVLVVEDDDIVRNLTCTTLKRYGYNIISAANPDDCLQLMKRYKAHIDLLLTDVVMPKLNGKKLYQLLVPSRPDLKLLYMSGYPDDVIAHHGIIEGNVNFIQKPFSIPNLTRKIREILDS